MHPTSYNAMAVFAGTLKGKLKVLDVGSRDINGTYRDLFSAHEYEGLDVVPGSNVDIVAEQPYNYGIDDESYDVVISGQALEHIEDDARAVNEMVRILKPGGALCLIAPSAGPKHMEPDYRRYTVESMRELAAGLDITECYWNHVGIWKDVVLIARKPKRGRREA